MVTGDNLSMGCVPLWNWTLTISEKKCFWNYSYTCF